MEELLSFSVLEITTRSPSNRELKQDALNNVVQGALCIPDTHIYYNHRHHHHTKKNSGVEKSYPE